MPDGYPQIDSGPQWQQDTPERPLGISEILPRTHAMPVARTPPLTMPASMHRCPSSCMSIIVELQYQSQFQV